MCVVATLAILCFGIIAFVFSSDEDDVDDDDEDFEEDDEWDDWVQLMLKYLLQLFLDWHFNVHFMNWQHIYFCLFIFLMD